MTATCVCRHQCAGGDKCSCNGAVPHTLHICRNPKCPCHTAAYHMDLVTDSAGREFYIPTGARLAPRKPVTA